MAEFHKPKQKSRYFAVESEQSELSKDHENSSHSENIYKKNKKMKKPTARAKTANDSGSEHEHGIKKFKNETSSEQHDSNRGNKRVRSMHRKNKEGFKEESFDSDSEDRKKEYVGNPLGKYRFTDTLHHDHPTYSKKDIPTSYFKYDDKPREKKHLNQDRPKVTGFHQHQLAQYEMNVLKVIEQKETVQFHLQEDFADLEDEKEVTDLSNLTQYEIRDAVDVATAQKFFELNLNQFGPYAINYSRNGRQLCLAGKKGHIAAFDWQTKNLMCEINVMERTSDVKWFHQETMFAVAQKKWTYVYDNVGVELHCLKRLNSILKMEFLPYHFLLVTGSQYGLLSYLDVTIGDSITDINTGMGPLGVMCQNPANAIICCGHPGGRVSMWSPNMNEPLVSILCSKGRIQSLAIDKTGTYMATSSMDQALSIWDLRTYKPVNTYKLEQGASHLAFSQKGHLAAGIGNVVEVYEGVTNSVVTKPYLTHPFTSRVHSLQFCPFEDILGVGHRNGFSSLIAPGTGEPNFDATELNPYQTKQQRQEMEVKLLLNKIQPEMITLDTDILGKVDAMSTEDWMQEKLEQHQGLVQKSDVNLRNRRRGGNKATRVQQRKQKPREMVEQNMRRKRLERNQDNDKNGRRNDV